MNSLGHQSALLALVLLQMQWASGCRRAAAPASLPPLALVVSGDTAGWIMPCGCSTKQAGGLARRGAYVRQRSEQGEVLVADVGGAPSGVAPYDLAKFAAIARGEVDMGLVAHNLGSAEIALGPAALKSIADDTQVPLVSANARDKSGQPLAPAVRIVRRAERRVALCGVLSPDYATPQVDVVDPAESLLRAIESVRGQYDVVVVLAYLKADELAALCRALPEVDIVVGGPTSQSIEPHWVGPTLLAAVTNKGKFIVHFDAPTMATPKWTGEIVELGDTWPDDKAQLANIEPFQHALAERDFTAAETSFVASRQAPSEASMRVAGTAACQDCHHEAHAAWRDSTHAQGWKTLSERGAQVDSYCQQCHTTGFGLAGGFVSANKSPHATAIGCESCHGPSQEHASDPRVRTPYTAADQCAGCHDRENSPEFTYASYWPRVEHGFDTTAVRRGDSTNSESRADKSLEERR